MKLRGYIVSPKMYPLRQVTYDDDFTSRGDYVMTFKQPPSWKTTLNDTKLNKSNKAKLKCLKVEVI